MPSYSRTSLANAISEVGVGEGDTVALNVSIGRLGLPEGASDIPGIARLVLDAFHEVIGDSGTLIVPTYTYSIGRGEVYEVETTPSAVGEFTEFSRHQPGSLRSRDPMLSNAGCGPRAEAILRNISRSCCGEGSVFHNLRARDAKICTLGLGLYYATFIQHIEEMSGAPFRMHKNFTGIVMEHGVKSEETWTYYAVPYLANCAPDPLAMEKRAREAGIVRIARVGRGQIMCVDANTYFEFGVRELKRDPWFTAKGPACDRDLMLRHMDAPGNG
jgi:aminoglycoside 3-N-acetyltransferase